jgi:hypothetical protein
MNSSEWLQVIDKAVESSLLEQTDSSIDSVALFAFEEGFTKLFKSVSGLKQAHLEVFNQVWSILSQIITNELQLEKWKTITINGRSRALTIKSLSPSPMFLMLIHDRTFDPNELMKELLKHLVELGFKEQYSTAGLVASEGYPVWVVSEDQEIDDFLFAISITSLLSLVERIDMEVSSGGISNCKIHGNGSLILNTSFNPSKDLAFAVTSKQDQIKIVKEDNLNTIFQNISDPILFSALVPEHIDPEREKILEELREEHSGEITDEELSTLNIFDAETLTSLVNEISAVSRNYGANEISIGYLRKRMKLPSEVLTMALEYLITNGDIKGKIGKEKQSGKEILVLEDKSKITGTELISIQNVQQQIRDLYLPLNPFLQQIPEEEPSVPTVAIQEEMSEVLSEFQVIQLLSDTDSLFLLIADLRILGTQMERSIKSIALLQEQVADSKDNVDFVEELKKRLDTQIEKVSEQRSAISALATRLSTDILNSYRILTKLLPLPTSVKYHKVIRKVSVMFKCGHAVCDQFLYLYDDPSIWRKLIFFAHTLSIIESYPEGWENLGSEQITEISQLYFNLLSLADSSEQLESLDSLASLSSLNDLLITNTERDKCISNLKQALDSSNNQTDFFSYFGQCSKCQKWYCQAHLKADDKCIYC